MQHILNMTPDDLAEFLSSLAQPAFRARQVGEWVWKKGVVDFAAMSNLSKDLRATLAERCAVLTGRVADEARAGDGVVKLLIEYPDGEAVECVWIPDGARRTVCLSTQAGCAMGCAFCASAEGGLGRDLTAGEIVEQVFHLWSAGGEKPTNVVLMGTGEPLANYDASVAAVRAIVDADRLGISPRRVTLSTVGLAKQIRRLAKEDLPITLAISLHAPNDALRRRLIPAAKATTISQILSAAREFFASRGREVTLEYVLLGGVNDTPACANELAQLAGNLRCNVNLIRFNPIGKTPFAPSPEPVVKAFRDRLAAAGVNVHIRASRGAGVSAACGQLRRRGRKPD
jgi:23S rRNA (adenine2503-C2)-methyltransferase